MMVAPSLLPMRCAACDPGDDDHPPLGQCVREAGHDGNHRAEHGGQCVAWPPSGIADLQALLLDASGDLSDALAQLDRVPVGALVSLAARRALRKATHLVARSRAKLATGGGL